eukprot:15072170-Alexandrium_andersonii.AAC.1
MGVTRWWRLQTPETSSVGMELSIVSQCERPLGHSNSGPLKQQALLRGSSLPARVTGRGGPTAAGPRRL